MLHHITRHPMQCRSGCCQDDVQHKQRGRVSLECRNHQVCGRLLHIGLHHHPAYWRPPPGKQTIWLRHLSLVLAQPPDPIGGQTGPEGGDRGEGDAGPGGGGHLSCLSRHLAMVGAPLERSRMATLAFCGSYSGAALGMPVSGYIAEGFG